MKNTLTIVLVLIAFSIKAQKPSDYFPATTLKAYYYLSLDKNLSFLQKWQVVASGNCEREQPEKQCLKIEMNSQSGNYQGKDGTKNAPEKMIQYEIKVEISAEYVNLMQWNRYEDMEEGLKSEVWTTEIPLIKIPDAGKTVVQTVLDNKYQVKVTIDQMPVFMLKEKKYQKILQATWELLDSKTGKYLGKRRFFFAKNIGLLRFESFNEKNELILNRSFELEKIN